MAHLTKLKAAINLNDVAILLGMKPAGLAFVLYKIPDQHKYTKFSVLKKSSGERIISAPTERLKLIQSRLGKLLEQCQLEVEAKLKLKPQCVLSHGFKTGFLNSNQCNKSPRVDVGFSIPTYKTSFRVLILGGSTGSSSRTIITCLIRRSLTVISQIACRENKLPQGSPCSPVISNIIANLLDIRLNELAAGNGCTYARYADDLTFSTNEKTFPSIHCQARP